MKRKIKMNKVKTIAIIVISMIFNFATSSGAVAVESETVISMYETNVLNSNDMVFRFWDYYTNNENDLFSPPDYFGGFSLNEDGGLIVYLAENTDTIKTAVMDICKSDNIHFEKVEYSFKELKETLDYISNGADNETISSISLDLDANKVVVRIEPDAISGSSTMYGIALGEMSEKINTSMVTVVLDEVDRQQKNVPEDEVPENVITDNILPRSSYYVFYPGQPTAFGDSQCGTIGFCAVDEEGTKLLITHGHGYEFDGSGDPDSVTVGGFTLEIYNISRNVTSGEDQMCDAAYIVVPNTVTRGLSNKVVNSGGTRITAAATVEQMLSYNNASVRAYGATTGFITTTASFACENGEAWIDMVDEPTWGDSGGPIYLIGTGENRLLGIISYEYGGGTAWTTIQARYENITGVSFEPYITSN